MRAPGGAGKRGAVGPIWLGGPCVSVCAVCAPPRAGAPPTCARPAAALPPGGLAPPGSHGRVDTLCHRDPWARAMKCGRLSAGRPVARGCGAGGGAGAGRGTHKVASVFCVCLTSDSGVLDLRENSFFILALVSAVEEDIFGDGRARGWGGWVCWPAFFSPRHTGCVPLKGESDESRTGPARFTVVATTECSATACLRANAQARLRNTGGT